MTTYEDPMAYWHGKAIGHDQVGHLPRRSEFIDKIVGGREQRRLDGKKKILFLPGPHQEMSLWDTSDDAPDKRAYFVLALYGVMESGRRLTVVIEDFRPYIAVRVPLVERDSANNFKESLFSKLNSHNDTKALTAKVQLLKRYLGYERDPYPYIIFEFAKLSNRRKALKMIKTDFQYETGWDDPSAYVNVFSRDCQMSLTQWLEIEADNYVMVKDPNFKDEEVLKVSFKFIKNYEGKMDRMSLIRDKTLVAYWDLETYARDRSVPRFDRKGTTMFQHSLVFAWANDPKPIAQYCFTTRPITGRAGFTGVLCENEAQMILSMGKIMELMQPEILGTFNGGTYDWPWLLNRAVRNNILVEFYELCSNTIPYKKLNNDDILKWNAPSEKVKIEADLSVNEQTLNIPGCQCIDVQNMFRQLYPTDGQWGLEYFLKKCKLTGKKDMPYTKIFETYEQIERIQDNQLYPHVMSYEKKQKLKSSNDVYSSSVLKGQVIQFDNENANNDADDVKGATATAPTATIIPPGEERDAAVADLYKEYVRTRDIMTDVAEYCVYDSLRCHQLMLKRGIISAKRMMAHISSTSLFCAIYRAGGCKARNVLIGEASRRGLVASNVSKKIKGSDKYPGAYVINPIPGSRTTRFTPEERKRKNQLYEEDKKAHPIRYTDSSIPERQQMPFPEWKAVVDAQIIALKSYVAERPEINPVAMPPLDAKALIKEVEKANPTLGKFPSCFVAYLVEPTSRPISGLDFASLYPSIDMAYNLSPEMMVTPESAGNFKAAVDTVALLKSEGEDIHRIDFKFGSRDIVGWCIRHQSKPEKMGVFPTVYVKLFALRDKFKVPFQIYKFITEYMAEHKKTRISYSDIVIVTKTRFGSNNPAKPNDMDDPIKILEALELYPSEAEIETIKARLGRFTVPSGMEKKIFLGLEKGTNTTTLESDPTDSFLDVDDVEFYYGHFNNKQLAVKIYMNTFYGESGNQLSALYMCEIAGGITVGGRTNLKFVHSIVTGLLCGIVYGDTDSLYISAPESKFQEIDHKYFCGKMTKLEYWTEMVKITFVEITKVRDIVNAELIKNNLTKFLKMAYEEVIWPYLLQRKKKYGGVQHIEMINFDIVDLFKLFLRGIDAKRRGISPLSVRATEHIMLTIFREDNLWTLRELALREIDRIYEDFMSGVLKVDDFVKSAKYQPISPEDRLAGKGNPSMYMFAERMAARGTPLTPYTRVPYVIARKYPNKYDFKGRKKVLSTGERMEPVEYVKENGIEIDIDYYMTNYVCGQLAPFISYHEDFYEAPRNDTNEEAKRAGDVSNKKARKWLSEYVKQYTKKYVDRGPLMKMLSKHTMDVIKQTYESIDEDDIYKTLNYDWNVGTTAKFKISVVKIADKLADQSSKPDARMEKAREFVKKAIKRHGKDYLYTLYKEYVSKSNSRQQMAKREYEERRAQYVGDLTSRINTVMSTLHKHISIIEQMTGKLRTLCGAETYINDPNKPIKGKTVERVMRHSFPDVDVEETLEAFETEVRDAVTKFTQDAYYRRGIRALVKSVRKLRDAKIRMMEIDGFVLYVSKKVKQDNGVNEPEEEDVKEFVETMSNAINGGETINEDDDDDIFASVDVIVKRKNSKKKAKRNSDDDNDVADEYRSDKVINQNETKDDADDTDDGEFGDGNDNTYDNDNGNDNDATQDKNAAMPLDDDAPDNYVSAYDM